MSSSGNSAYIADLASRVTAIRDEGQQKGVLDAAASFFMPTRTSGLVNSAIGDCKWYCALLPVGSQANSEIDKLYHNYLQVPLHPVVDWSKLNQGSW